MGHAKLSPSSAVRWMSCPGSVALSQGVADKGSQYANDGTSMHTVAELCLTTGSKAAEYVGQTFSRDGFHTLFTPELATATQQYVDYVNDVVASTGGTLLVEQRLPISSLTGEPDAYGTSDVVILAGDELIVTDLKGGMGVAVDAIENPQLQIYALAAYEEFSLAYDFKQVRMVIHQPRLNSVSEWVQSVDDLVAFGVQVTLAAEQTRLPDAPLHPTTKGCKFCKAKATCPAIAKEVLEAFEVVSEPGDADVGHLAMAMAKSDLIEGWVKAIRAEVERRMLEGKTVPGYKLVQGKRGNRAWANPAEAEEWLKARVKLDEMYDFKLASPTTISKRLEEWVDAEGMTRKPVLGVRQQKMLLDLITQKDGSPSVAPESDKRPALVFDATAEFSDLS